VNEFGVLYTADSQRTAVREVISLFGPVPRSADLLLSLKVKLQRILDLTDPRTVAALGTSPEELVTGSRFMKNAERQVLPTQTLGLACHLNNNISAIKAPSAACAAEGVQGFCLVILMDHLLPDEYVKVVD
jgi:RES domain-containing protein